MVIYYRYMDIKSVELFRKSNRKRSHHARRRSNLDGDKKMEKKYRVRKLINLKLLRQSAFVLLVDY